MSGLGRALVLVDEEAMEKEEEAEDDVGPSVMYVEDINQADGTRKVWKYVK